MKIINKSIINSILYRYPIYNIKNLNIYSNNINNNILFDDKILYYIVKPQGKKAFLWFTYIEKKTIVILIFVNNNNLYDAKTEFYEYDLLFDNTLSYNNVLLYGYYINYNEKNYFIIENVYNYNIYNDYIQQYDYNNNFDIKIKLYKNILPLITNVSNYFIKIPLIYNNSSDIFKNINKINYKLYAIAGYSKNKFVGNYILNKEYKKNILITFKIVPCIPQDLYNLIILTNKGEEIYDLALIDSYDTSIFMNKIFRKIKENNNLDLLEESDSEEEFENINKDKYVNLNKNKLIECEYNIKFKKWIPKKISNNKIIDKNNLQKIMKLNNIIL